MLKTLRVHGTRLSKAMMSSLKWKDSNFIAPITVMVGIPCIVATKYTLVLSVEYFKYRHRRNTNEMFILSKAKAKPNDN